MAPENLPNLKLIQTEPYAPGLLDGFNNQIDPGSGLLRVGGLENEISFNSYRLNIKSNIDKIQITSIEGLADADIRDSREVNPGYDGETAFQSYYGGRTIVLNGKIKAHTMNKLRDMQDGLKSVFAPLVEKDLVLRGKTREDDLVISCKKSQPIVMSEVQQNFQFERDFQVTLRASDFRFRTEYIYSTNWKNPSSWATPTQSSSAEEKFVANIVNKGNYLADLTLKIKGPITAASNGGPGILIKNRVDDTYIENSNALSAAYTINGVSAKTALTTIDNNFIQINALPGTTTVLGSNDFIVINSTTRTITRFDNGSDTGITAFNQFDISSEWIKLSPGINPIYATCFQTSNPEITLYNRHTYI